VVLGDVQGTLTLQLARDSELVVYAQLARGEDVAAVRQAAADAGLYGTRIFVEQGDVTQLYLADNLADAGAAIGPAAGMPEAELLRVLRPRGKAIRGAQELIKPVPDGVDDWSHPYRGPDNNPQSQDRLARGPYLTQFLADPRYAPLPQVAVAAGGRVFKAFGHIAFKVREESWLDTLAAFDGYNGTLLWRREIPAALMVHRNSLIATPTTLYFGDDKSCKVIDAATGETRDEIAPPAELTGGTFWKWMALEDGVLYALIGEQEQRDPVVRLRSTNHGWPWNPLSPGYNQPEHTWGFGRTLLAIDPHTKKILWRHQEPEPIDSRALCMSHGRIFAFRMNDFLTCLDAQTGQPVWRKTPQNDEPLFEALGGYLNRQDWRTNWRTTAYLKCSGQALYFAGPQVGKLVAVSAADGRLLWQHPYSNYQLVLRDDGLYAISGQVGAEVGMDNQFRQERARIPEPSRKFDPLTGEILAEFDLGRRACTRPTGSMDAVFCRASGGSTRLDVASNQWGLISPMRAQCHDGVTIANGLLYWWPSTCDCNLTLYGITCLGPAGDYAFNQAATDADRLESSAASAPVAAWPQTVADWPTFRADNSSSGTTSAKVPATVSQAWRAALPPGVTPTAPTAVGELVFVAASDGVVRALDAVSGQPKWTAFTGGAIRMPPTIADGRALAGSGDGWVYAWEAATGRLLWRFRAAPVERRIPVYGQLSSNWPAASGVLVDDGVAYVAAGIVNYDGTHVYALDAATGSIKWQNNETGHMDPMGRTGVSVQGQMLAFDGRLWLAGGNVVSPAAFDLQNGRCLNDPAQHIGRKQNNNVPASESPRGCELHRIGSQVFVSGKPYYAHPQYPVYDWSVTNKTVYSCVGELELAWFNSTKLACYDRGQSAAPEAFARAWGKPDVPDRTPRWTLATRGGRALAVGENAAVVATETEVQAIGLSDGQLLWTHPLAAPPVPWGLALTRDGRVLVALENGEVICLEPALDSRL
jgi:outer membrane protein assembly factor BamB